MWFWGFCVGPGNPCGLIGGCSQTSERFHLYSTPPDQPRVYYWALQIDVAPQVLAPRFCEASRDLKVGERWLCLTLDLKATTQGPWSTSRIGTRTPLWFSKKSQANRLNLTWRKPGLASSILVLQYCEGGCQFCLGLFGLLGCLVACLLVCLLALFCLFVCLLVGWLVACFVGWLVGWLVCCLIALLVCLLALFCLFVCLLVSLLFDCVGCLSVCCCCR